MTRRRRGLPLLLAGLLLIAGSRVCAHDFWIEPSSFQPPPDSALRVRLLVGENFQGEPLPRYKPWIERFELASAAGLQPVLGTEGSEPAGITRIGPAGLYLVLYQSQANRLEASAELFQKYLEMEGLAAIQALRAERGETGKPVRELFYRCAKALVAAAGSGAGPFAQPLGLTLELVPEAQPYALAPGDELPVRLLFRGKPVPAVLVMALNRSAPAEVQRLRSDAEGRVTFTLPRGGLWLVKAVHCLPARDGQDADYESWWASLTFELPD